MSIYYFTRVHFYNAGFLVKGKSPIDFATGTNGPIARNSLINTVLYLNKTIESFGTGFGRVLNYVKRIRLKQDMGIMILGLYSNL